MGLYLFGFENSELKLLTGNNVSYENNDPINAILLADATQKDIDRLDLFLEKAEKNITDERITIYFNLNNLDHISRILKDKYRDFIPQILSNDIDPHGLFDNQFKNVDAAKITKLIPYYADEAHELTSTINKKLNSEIQISRARMAIIDDAYLTDIPRKTILVWSMLFTWQNSGNSKNLRNELQTQASVPDGTFDKYVSEFVEQGIIDSGKSCRLRTDNGSFREVKKLVEVDLGPIEKLPFNGFKFSRNDETSMRKVWAEGGCQLIIDTWANVPDIKYEINDWNNAYQYEGRTVTFKTTPNKPAIIFLFTIRNQPSNRGEFAHLFYRKAQILEEDKMDVITLAGALSFGSGTFRGDMRVLMFGPITLTTIIQFFNKYPDHTAELYEGFIQFLHPITGQKEGIVKGDGLIKYLNQVVELNN